MATVAQHFERLCECLEVADELNHAEASEYLGIVLQTIRPLERNRLLRIWFMQATLDLLARKERLDTPASVP